jgi:hypothetical protein
MKTNKMTENESAICEQCGIKYYKRFEGKQYSCPNNHDPKPKPLGEPVPAQDIMTQWNMTDVSFVEFVIAHLPRIYFEWDKNRIALPWKKALLPWRKDSWEPIYRMGKAELMRLLIDEQLFFYRANIEEFEEAHKKDDPAMICSTSPKATSNKKIVIPSNGVRVK